MKYIVETHMGSYGKHDLLQVSPCFSYDKTDLRAAFTFT